MLHMLLVISTTRQSQHTLCLPEHGRVLLLLVWQAPQKGVHVESIKSPGSLILPRRTCHVFPIGIEETCKASHKGGPDTVCVESRWTHEGYMSQAATMRERAARLTLVDAIAIRLIVTDRAGEAWIARVPDHAVTLDPDCRVSILHGLHQHVGHHGRGGQRRCRVR